MSNEVRAGSERYHAGSPYLIVANAAAGIKFDGDVFGAKVKRRLGIAGGIIAHARRRLLKQTYDR